MSAIVVPFPKDRLEPLPPLEQVHARLIEMAADTANMAMPHLTLRQRMLERGVFMRQLLETIRAGSPVQKVSVDERGDCRIKLRRLVAGRKVQVEVIVRNDHFEVITVV